MLFARYLLWAFAKVVLSLRYRIRVHGLDKLRGLTGKTLILPNHPGYIDPAIVLTILWPSQRCRPLVFQSDSPTLIFRLMMKMIDGVPMPELERPSAEARAMALAGIKCVIEGLQQGESYILWPAGHVQRDGTEHLGGSQAAVDILQAVPDVELVLVRTRGLWGSSFTWAKTGRKPSLSLQIKKGIGLLLANLFVFAPRRRLDITIERVDKRTLPGDDAGARDEPTKCLPVADASGSCFRRETLNPWLEKWYNALGAERPTFVPYHFLFGPRTYRFPKPTNLASADLSAIMPATKEAVAHLLEDLLGRPLSAEEKRPDTSLDRQLGLNSMDRMDLTLTIEQRFGFSATQAPTTVGEAWALAEGKETFDERPGAKGPEPRKRPPGKWFRPPIGEQQLVILGETIPEAFVARALANRKDMAAADDLAGVVTYERMLIGALVMARRFTQLPAPNVGLMLPASVASDIALMGLQMAGKLPVALNWTTGPVHLAHAAKVMGLTHVVTSSQFINRTAIQVEGVQYLYLEDLRKGIGRVELLRTLLAIRWLPGRIRRQVPRLSADQPAVVLFTSGSEKAPKAVPLTHANIISNTRAGIASLAMTRGDIMFGFLPAFHGFGLTVTGLMPLMAGMRVLHHPDPTDSAGIVRKIAVYRPTMLVGTPTFVSYILDRAQHGDLDSLRLIVVGAEKCPQQVLDQCARLVPAAHILEGYGITECSPIISVNVPEANRPGTVGQPLRGVEVCVINPETGEELPPNLMGELWVAGPSVFPGYLAYDGPTPFRTRDGKHWYATGDLVEIDTDGFIRFCGRQKRFLKIGGEMISLVALEEPFARLFPPTEEGPRVAVEGVEAHGNRRIVLFSTEPITLREANSRLWDEGFRGVLRFDEVRRVDQIPKLGTGKTDYKVLRSQIQLEESKKVS